MQQFINNWRDLLGAAAATGANSLTISTAKAALLAGASASAPYRVTLDKDPTNPDAVKEVVTVTGANGSTGVLTLAVALANDWAVGDVIEARLTAQVMRELLAADGSVPVSGSLFLSAPIINLMETVAAPTVDDGTGRFQFDLGTGDGYYPIVLNANGVLQLNNPPLSGTLRRIIVSVTQTSAYALSWPSSVKWGAAGAPTITTTAGAIDDFELYTADGGRNFFARVMGQGYVPTPPPVA